jgi:ankyrin repeat protein
VLILQPIDLNAQDITLKTPLMKATRNGKIDAVKRLVDAGCSLNVRDKNRDTALHFAARHGSAPLVHVLIQAGSDVNIQNQWGHTPLMEAVCYNNKDASARLLQASCDVNLRDYKCGDSALHISVRKNYHVIVEQLLATQEVKYVYNYQGELACYDAVINQKMDTLRLFLRYNFDLDKPVKLEYDGTGGKTVIKIALERGHFDLLRLMARVGFVISFSIGAPPAKPKGGPVAALFDAHAQQQGAQAAGVDSEQVYAIQKFLASIRIVRTLKEMCRKTIRQRIGFGVDKAVVDLPIPETLKHFLCLYDIFPRGYLKPNP